MKPLEDPEAAAWGAKADHDLRAATILFASGEPLYDVICFHCQQVAEKSLKMLLVAADQQPPRTHDLVELVALAAVHAPGVLALEPEALELLPYSVLPRYPSFLGESGRPDAQRALDAAHRFREQTLALLRPGAPAAPG
ncbi:MAG: HEPN domain-containing protein [Myxococcota bacterium]|jgi:HEPN domain-containing protein|nr:HEPN domain-containing protein [Myxococcota bacterium]